MSLGCAVKPWRDEFRRRTIAASVWSLAIGLILVVVAALPVVGNAPVLGLGTPSLFPQIRVSTAPIRHYGIQQSCSFVHGMISTSLDATWSLSEYGFFESSSQAESRTVSRWFPEQPAEFATVVHSPALAELDAVLQSWEMSASSPASAHDLAAKELLRRSTSGVGSDVENPVSHISVSANAYGWPLRCAHIADVTYRRLPTQRTFNHHVRHDKPYAMTGVPISIELTQFAESADEFDCDSRWFLADSQKKRLQWIAYDKLAINSVIDVLMVFAVMEIAVVGYMTCRRVCGNR